MEVIVQKLNAIEAMLKELVSARLVKDFYSVDEVAERVERSPYQVREWCREGRILAQKRAVGRGRSTEWMVSHDELTRYQSHGLRPR